MKNKKGFTLVELLSVIIVLIVIMLLALNIIRTYTKKSKNESLRANALNYVKAIELLIESNPDDETFDSGSFTVSELSNLGVKLSGTLPEAGNVLLIDYEIVQACLKYDDYVMNYIDGKLSDPKKGGSCQEIGDFNKEFQYTGTYDSFEIPVTGYYKIELWGASGSSNEIGGKGAYTSGIINLDMGTVLYFYVGQGATNNVATFYGGGSCGSYCTAGGGATDVRLAKGSWNSSDSLASRIMVAAGGAGYNGWRSGYRGGDGGTLSGFVGEGDSPTTPGSQTAAGVSYGNDAAKNGSFGKGGNGENYGGGGSGGYWGGAAGKNSGTGNGGSSGSSYISGHLGCVAITSRNTITPKEGCANGTTDISCSIHYSGNAFVSTQMLSGRDEMPTYNGLSVMKGNLGNGYAKIAFVGRTLENDEEDD